jgi:hypothetical protein
MKGTFQEEQLGVLMKASAPFVIAHRLIVVLYKESWKNRAAAKYQYRQEEFYGLDKWSVDFFKVKALKELDIQHLSRLNYHIDALNFSVLSVT